MVVMAYSSLYHNDTWHRILNVEIVVIKMKVRGWVSPTASRVSYVLQCIVIQRVLSYWLHVNKPSKTLDLFESLGIDAHADQPLKQQLSIVGDRKRVKLTCNPTVSARSGERIKCPYEYLPPATEEPKVEEKPLKEKKPRTPREKKPRQPKPKAVAHPPYFQMIKEAILALNEKSGSSPYAIAKYMEEKHKAVLPANFKKILGLQLKNSAARGKLIKIRASYKLSEAGKKEKSTTGKVSKGSSAVKKTKEVKPSMRKTRSVNKADAGAKKVVGAKKAKKSAASKPKQPKSIKSPAAKRAKKVTATA
ncbi:hypothetical protein D5086_010600 [Populus alba]|uniref:Uncharacterized protein n=1 Tax=Populus alba TaxID=43335 RepID=A0ACC4CBL1_POPAL